MNPLSSVIDAGSSLFSPANDILGNSRPIGNGIDLGCYEFQDFNVWTGNVSTAWNNAGNWSLGSVPTSSELAYIPDVVNNPIVNIPSATCARLVLDTNSSITLYNNSNKLVTNQIELFGGAEITIFAGEIECNGDLEVKTGHSSIDVSGILDVNGNISGSFDNPVSGTIITGSGFYIAGDWDVSDLITNPITYF